MDLYFVDNFIFFYDGLFVWNIIRDRRPSATREYNYINFIQGFAVENLPLRINYPIIAHSFVVRCRFIGRCRAFKWILRGYLQWLNHCRRRGRMTLADPYGSPRLRT